VSCDIRGGTAPDGGGTFVLTLAYETQQAMTASVLRAAEVTAHFCASLDSVGMRSRTKIVTVFGFLGKQSEDDCAGFLEGIQRDD
jgi:hypothetical protein